MCEIRFHLLCTHEPHTIACNSVRSSPTRLNVRQQNINESKSEHVSRQLHRGHSTPPHFFFAPSIRTARINRVRPSPAHRRRHHDHEHTHMVRVDVVGPAAHRYWWFVWTQCAQYDARHNQSHKHTRAAQAQTTPLKHTRHT